MVTAAVEKSTGRAPTRGLTLGEPTECSPEVVLVVRFENFGKKVKVQSRPGTDRIEQLAKAADPSRLPQAVDKGSLGAGDEQGRAPVGQGVVAQQGEAAALQRERVWQELDRGVPKAQGRARRRGEDGHAAPVGVRHSMEFEGRVVTKDGVGSRRDGDEKRVGCKALCSDPGGNCDKKPTLDPLDSPRREMVRQEAARLPAGRVAPCALQVLKPKDRPLRKECSKRERRLTSYAHQHRKTMLLRVKRQPLRQLFTPASQPTGTFTDSDGLIRGNTRPWRRGAIHNDSRSTSRWANRSANTTARPLMVETPRGISTLRTWLAALAALSGLTVAPLAAATNKVDTFADSAPAAADSVAPPAGFAPSLEELARLIPAHSARVVSSSPPRTAGAPTVVVLRAAHINEAHPAEPNLPPYQLEQRRRVNTVVVQAFEVAEALVAAGQRVVVAERQLSHLDEPMLTNMARLGLFADLASILAAEPALRHALVRERLGAGSNLDLSFAIALAFGPRVHVEGVESEATVRRMIELGAGVNQLEAGLAHPNWLALRADVGAGRADVPARERYNHLRDQGIAILDQFCQKVITARDREIALGALALAKREGASAVLLPVGGFHTEGIVAHLAEQGAGSVVVEPLGYAVAAPTLQEWREHLLRQLHTSARGGVSPLAGCF